MRILEVHEFVLLMHCIQASFSLLPSKAFSIVHCHIDIFQKDILNKALESSILGASPSIKCISPR